MDGTELFTAVTRICESLTAGLSTRMDTMTRQLETLPEIREKLSAISSVQQDAIKRADEAAIDAKEAHNRISAVELAQAEMKGKLQVVVGILVFVGCPLLVLLMAAGIAKLFNINLEGL